MVERTSMTISFPDKVHLMNGPLIMYLLHTYSILGSALLLRLLTVTGPLGEDRTNTVGK